MAATMTDLAAIYDNPTGTIDVTNIQAALTAIDARLTELHLDWLPDLVAEGLMRLGRRIADTGLSEEGDAGAPSKRTVIDAVVDMTRICRGWSDTPATPDAAANGTFLLTAVVDDGKLRQDVWGSASACRTRLEPETSSSVVNANLAANLSIDGPLNVRLYGPLPLSVGAAQFLLLFSGRLGTDDRTSETSFDFRVLDGHFDFRFAVSDGDIIVEVGATSISLRAANGTFTCDLASRSCQ